jgi:hypothetical protein
MTTAEAREHRLDLYAFTSMSAALLWAFEHLTYMHGEPCAVACFHEEVAHFDVFWVAVRPAPPMKKFHERIAQS